ncbi:MAG: penicillin acylase family protein [Candidatus Thorarchaeota archaeon]
MKRKIAKLGLSFIGPILMIVILTMPIGPLTGGLGIIQPIGGIFDYGAVAIPPNSQQVTLSGLDADVDVFVDHVGIPHIYATTVEDAFMALGYIHASERLFQMMMQNMMAAGRISEIVGGYAASSDRTYRTIGLARSAQLELDWYVDNIDHPVYGEDVEFILGVIDAEVAGVNAYIDSLTVANTPIEFKILAYTPRHWTRHDVFLFAKMMSWGLSGGGYTDIYRAWIQTQLDNATMMEELFPDIMPNTVPIIPEQYNLNVTEYPLYARAPGDYPAPVIPSSLEYSDAVVNIPQEKLEAVMDLIETAIAPLGDLGQIGSNNWVVHGDRTETGMPILANDPHLGFQAPALWYEAHMVVPGELDVTGVTLPGLPGVLLGHNDKIAWGFTNVGADVTDFFVEDLVDGNPDKYWYDGEQLDFEIIEENILTAEGTVIPFEVKVSVHGPLIDSAFTRYDMGDLDEPYLAMNWIGNSVTHEIMALGMLQKAQNINDYHEAMFWWDNPGQNIVYADVDGNIAMTVTGRLPVRHGYSGTVPVDGSDSSVGMLEYIPFAHNPRAVNPSQGYIQSANQRSIDPVGYSYDILGPFADGYRGRRIDSLLANNEDVSVDDMKEYQADSVEVAAEVIVPYIINAWDASGEVNQTVADAVDWFREWDYSMETDEIAPTFWWVIRDILAEWTFDELGSINPGIQPSRLPILEEMLVTGNEYWFDRQLTAEVETSVDIIVISLHQALNKMLRDYGSDEANWEYGKHHRVYLWDLMSMTYIGGGAHRGGQTLNAAGSWSVTHGPSWRMVADLEDIAMSYGAYPGGQSGNMFSPHYDDLFYDYWYNYNETAKQYGYHQMYFYGTKAAIEAADATSGGTLIERTITFLAP